ncbi:histone-like nucleoid-structuring protein Lsr2 [Actinomycetospora endophytica]|uniref:histone-like nucleoid-structuring protein Lsr2 n=1 Tax=Actinomycetospora endophytica TaxID=2291215 RepID=UPI0027E2AF0E|nr:Lsr2 family protein [Actinomycetospora endophytica]
MATRTLVTLVDDLDGTTADESVSFGLEGVGYEIDLTTEHAAALREILAPFVAAARRTGGRQSSRPAAAAARPASPSGAGAVRSRSTNVEIRSWAAEHGVELAERGRIPSRVVQAFEAGDPALLPTGGSSSSAPAAPAEPVASTPAEPAAATAPAASTEGEEPRGRDGLTGTERETIRAWAVEEGIEVKPRGQLKKDLISNYRALEARRG